MKEFIVMGEFSHAPLHRCITRRGCRSCGGVDDEDLG